MSTFVYSKGETTLGLCVHGLHLLPEVCPGVQEVQPVLRHLSHRMAHLRRLVRVFEELLQPHPVPVQVCQHVANRPVVLRGANHISSGLGTTNVSKVDKTPTLLLGADGRAFWETFTPGARSMLLT